MMTLEQIQQLFNEFHDYAQLLIAILSIVTLVSPLLKTFHFYQDAIDYVSAMLEITVERLWQFTPFANATSSSYESPESICVRTPNASRDNNIVVSGLVNTGNSCFLNSVLQALSSLPRLHCYLNETPQRQLRVTQSLHKTIRLLSKPLERRSYFKPTDVVKALSANHRVVINREQQDAQELFQLLAGAIDSENQTLAKSGLESLLSHKNSVRPAGRLSSYPLSPSISKKMTPFTGLLASRLSCMQCGYTEAIRHFTFNNIQLILPIDYTTTLDACLRQYTSIEYLKDVSCRKCSLMHTHRVLATEIAKLKKMNIPQRQKSNRLKLATLERQSREIERCLSSNRIEDEIEGIRRTVSRLSTKQVMFAKPPEILCLHLSRSAFHASGAVYKNGCRILFPEYLDLSPYITNGTLSTQPNMPISTAASNSHFQRSRSRSHYRLMSIVVHFGSHSHGHFVTFKRRIITEKCACTMCIREKQLSGNNCVTEAWDNHDGTWYRISDTKVDICSYDLVQQSNPYMLLYELLSDDEDSDDKEAEIPRKEDVQMDEVAEEEADTPLYVSATYSSEAEEALRIANSLLMEDRARRKPEAPHHSWPDEQRTLVSC
ncbi:hypothetical protein BX666DRAFT_935272 [Dichotomocladium elegans]|nr:hypothetical protein BX666DRAFT_935272 [Dichotomocladium elegans]